MVFPQNIKGSGRLSMKSPQLGSLMLNHSTFHLWMTWFIFGFHPNLYTGGMPPTSQAISLTVRKLSWVGKLEILGPVVPIYRTEASRIAMRHLSPAKSPTFSNLLPKDTHRKRLNTFGNSRVGWAGKAFNFFRNPWPSFHDWTLVLIRRQLYLLLSQ